MKEKVCQFCEKGFSKLLMHKDMRKYLLILEDCGNSHMICNDLIVFRDVEVRIKLEVTKDNSFDGFSLVSNFGSSSKYSLFEINVN